MMRNKALLPLVLIWTAAAATPALAWGGGPGMGHGGHGQMGPPMGHGAMGGHGGPPMMMGHMGHPMMMGHMGQPMGHPGYPMGHMGQPIGGYGSGPHPAMMSNRGYYPNTGHSYYSNVSQGYYPTNRYYPNARNSYYAGGYGNSSYYGGGGYGRYGYGRNWWLPGAVGLGIGAAYGGYSYGYPYYPTYSYPTQPTYYYPQVYSEYGSSQGPQYASSAGGIERVVEVVPRTEYRTRTEYRIVDRPYPVYVKPRHHVVHKKFCNCGPNWNHPAKPQAS